MPEQENAWALKKRKTWVGCRIDVECLELQRIHPGDESLGERHPGKPPQGTVECFVPEPF
jgi:hypothetical protein